jgi:hypothetical protein
MRWLRLLVSVPLILIGVLITALGVWGSLWLWINDYDEHWIVAIMLVLAWGGQAIGGLFCLYLGARTFKRNAFGKRNVIGGVSAA